MADDKPDKPKRPRRIVASAWVKYTVNLRKKLEIYQMAKELSKDELYVCGAVAEVWVLADSMTDEDGFAPGMTLAFVNSRVCDGIAEAMVLVGWLEEDEGGLRFPNYSRHNGENARVRLEANLRKQKERAKEERKGTKKPKQPSTPPPVDPELDPF